MLSKEIVEIVLKKFKIAGNINIDNAEKISPDFRIYDITINDNNYLLCQADYIHDPDEALGAAKHYIANNNYNYDFQLIKPEQVNQEMSSGDWQIIIDRPDLKHLSKFALVKVKSAA